MDTQKKFHAEVEAFIKSHGFSPTGFGKAALKDPNFVWRLRRNDGITIRTMDRVLEFMQKQHG